MKKTTRIALIGSLALALAAGIAFQASARGGPGGDAKGKNRGARIAKKMNLTDAQVVELKTLRTAMKAAVSPLKTEMRTLRGELEQLWLADSPDRGAIDQKLAEIDAVRAQIRDSRVDFKFAVLPLLDAEQRVKFLSMERRHGKRHFKRGGKRGKRGERGMRGKRGKRDSSGWLNAADGEE